MIEALSEMAINVPTSCLVLAGPFHCVFVLVL